MSTKLKIGYFYKHQLNLYGDNGNVEILCRRAQMRGFSPEVIEVGLGTVIDTALMRDFDIVFMGGGPDSQQKVIYEDLLKFKGPYLKEFIFSGGCGLFICGSFQLLGEYYKASDGFILQGLGTYNMFTEHFGPKKPRCIGNTYARLCPALLNDPVFKNNNYSGDTIVGFENHGGRTYLENKSDALAQIVKGSGNNAEDRTEGIFLNNSIGTYFHGPFLSKNPHVADFLIAKSLNIDKLEQLDDSLILKSRTATVNLKQ